MFELLQVMRRDNYTCVATGIPWVGRETWENGHSSLELAMGLRITHIFKDLKGLFRNKVRLLVPWSICVYPARLTLGAIVLHNARPSTARLRIDTSMLAH